MSVNALQSINASHSVATIPRISMDYKELSEYVGDTKEKLSALVCVAVVRI